MNVFTLAKFNKWSARCFKQFKASFLERIRISKHTQTQLDVDN